MHPNEALIHRLYSSLDARDPDSMAACYHPEASFRDIAFDLTGARRIHAMWAMICSRPIHATFDAVRADDQTGSANLLDVYVFSDTQFEVRNRIQSRFRFRDGLIARHEDFCDAKAWARMAFGRSVKGFLAGHFRWVRAMKANAKLDAFIVNHPKFHK